jgi:phosphate/sulfate permease
MGLATSVATRVLTAKQAVTLAAVFNLLGAMAGTAVATTIASGLVDGNFVTLTTIFCALVAAITWNLVTWWFGLPSSSSHALIGGLCGSALVTAAGNWHVIKWAVTDPLTHKTSGLLYKVVVPMLVSPICGCVGGFRFMGLMIALLREAHPAKLNKVFGKAQIGSAAWMSFSHGLNDAQKTMGSKLVRLQTTHGFAAQATAAAVINIASLWAMPLSSTHVISTSIMGVGATKRLSAVRWKMMGRIVTAWVLTLPLPLGVGFALMWLCMHLGWTTS